MDKIFTLQKRATLAKTLRDAGTVGIIASNRQTHDTIGAALALYLALIQSKKNAQIVSAQDPLVEISNLFGIDKIKKSFDTAIKQLTISFPYVEGEIERAMYKAEDGKINVHFHAAKDKTITFSESDVEYIKKGGSPELIFAVAVSDEEIKEFISDRKGVKIIRISRHPSDTSGDIVYQDTNFSSVSEIVSKIIQEQGLATDQDIAQNLLDGIIYATNNFTHYKTSLYAFDAAGFLMKKGAERKSKTEIRGEGPKSGEKREEFQLKEKPKKEEGDLKEKEEVNFESRSDEQPTQETEGNSEEEEELKKEEKFNTRETKQPQEEAEARGEQSSEEDETRNGEKEVPSDWFEPKVFRTTKDK